jgi:hypothetical protein
MVYCTFIFYSQRSCHAITLAYLISKMQETRPDPTHPFARNIIPGPFLDTFENNPNQIVGNIRLWKKVAFDVNFFMRTFQDNAALSGRPKGIRLQCLVLPVAERRGESGTTAQRRIPPGAKRRGEPVII